jgi:hypothetical protein
MSSHVQQKSAGRRAVLLSPRLAPVLLAPLLLGGCFGEAPRLAGINCKRMKSTELRVAAGQTCKFNYAQGDMAKYVVVVTRAPMHGKASGDGKYLQYVARPGFAGEDRVSIRVERRGVGHVQWEDLTVRVRVGPTA